MSRRRPPSRQGGFALLTVLWALALAALLGAGLAATGRQDAQRLRNLLGAAAAEAVAEGALHQAIFGLLDPSERRWSPDGATRRLRQGDHLAEVRVEDEGGKVNPNIAGPELLQALMVQLGTPPPVAAGLAAAILDWRGGAAEGGPQGAPYATAGLGYAPPGEPFESLDELGAVLGMPAELLARMRPHLTLFTGTDPDPATAGPVVAAALASLSRGPARREAGSPRARATMPRAATVRVAVRGPERAAFGLRVVVRISPLSPARPYEILSRERLSVAE